jgi:hypothetical protein
MADTDVISVFWSGTTCRTMVHELGHDQLKTMKELLDIATRHASSKEAVGAAFILGNAKIAASDSRTTPSKATIKSTRKGANGGRGGVEASSDDDDDEKASDSG